MNYNCFLLYQTVLVYTYCVMFKDIIKVVGHLVCCQSTDATKKTHFVWIIQ